MVDRNRFEILEENIESIIDHCREAGIVVCDYQPSVSFQKKINDLVYKLQVRLILIFLTVNLNVYSVKYHIFLLS